MRIGILTLPFHTNYGGIMQAYALQNVLKRMGHQSYVLNVSYWGDKKHNLLSLLLLRVYFNLRKLLSPEYNSRKEINKFIEYNIEQKHFNSFYRINESDFDAIIVGSDQIWREIFIPKIENTFLDFTNGWKIKRIAYAASFGTDIWAYTSQQTKNCSKLIQQFDVVSVREKTAVALCEEYLNTKAIHVLDPTLLLSKDDYIQLLNIKERKTKGIMLSYIVNETENVRKIASAISKDNKFENRLICPDAKSADVLPSISEWLQIIQDADFVFTDSFHVTVFSILFRKHFVVIKNKESGNTRLESLMEMLNLNGHMISEETKIDDAVLYCRNIQPLSDMIYDVLDIKKQESVKILASNLK